VQLDYVSIVPATWRAAVAPWIDKLESGTHTVRALSCLGIADRRTLLLLLSAARSTLSCLTLSVQDQCEEGQQELWDTLAQCTQLDRLHVVALGKLLPSFVTFAATHPRLRELEVVAANEVMLERGFATLLRNGKAASLQHVRIRGAAGHWTTERFGGRRVLETGPCEHVVTYTEAKLREKQRQGDRDAALVPVLAALRREPWGKQLCGDALYDRHVWQLVAEYV
jgi:hypothetical protein